MCYLKPDCSLSRPLVCIPASVFSRGFLQRNAVSICHMMVAEPLVSDFLVRLHSRDTLLLPYPEMLYRNITDPKNWSEFWKHQILFKAFTEWQSGKSFHWYRWIGTRVLYVSPYWQVMSFPWSHAVTVPVTSGVTTDIHHPSLFLQSAVPCHMFHPFGVGIAS